MKTHIEGLRREDAEASRLLEALLLETASLKRLFNEAVYSRDRIADDLLITAAGDARTKLRRDLSHCIDVLAQYDSMLQSARGDVYRATKRAARAQKALQDAERTET
jgi:hypothetical protein